MDGYNGAGVTGNDAISTLGILSGFGRGGYGYGYGYGGPGSGIYGSIGANAARLDGVADQLSNLQNENRSRQNLEDITRQNAQTAEELSRQNTNMSSQLSVLAGSLGECCCEQRIATEQVKAQINEQTAQIEARCCDLERSFTAQHQAIQDSIVAGRIESKDDQIEVLRQQAQTEAINSQTGQLLQAVNQQGMNTANAIAALAEAIRNNNGHGHHGGGRGRSLEVASAE